ncbi:MAG: c-type cytochrome domain-containing protein [Rhodoplanes sp.]
MRLRTNIILNVPALLSASLLVAVASSAARAAEEQVSYKLDVQPIIQSRCTSCHQPGGEGYQASGLDLTSYQGLMKGTKHGAIVVPGDPLTSNLMVLVEGRAHPKVRMPHGQRPLLKQQTEILRFWVKQGAKDN